MDERRRVRHSFTRIHGSSFSSCSLAVEACFDMYVWERLDVLFLFLFFVFIIGSVFCVFEKREGSDIHTCFTVISIHVSHLIFQKLEPIPSLLQTMAYKFKSYQNRLSTFRLSN